MIVLLLVFFGAIVGLICFAIYGSGYGIWWDVVLGISGSIIGSSIMTAGYFMYHFGRADVLGFNWYSLSIGMVGAVAVVYVGMLFKKFKLI